MTGTIKFFDRKKGWGFVTDSNNKDVFVHHSNIAVTEGFRTLYKNDIVEFDIEVDDNGKEHAINVTPIATMKMIKKAIGEHSIYVEECKNGLGMKCYMVGVMIDPNIETISTEQGKFIKINGCGRLDTEGLAG